MTTGHNGQSGWLDSFALFQKSEDYYVGGDEMHGSGGEWRVEEQRLSWEILTISNRPVFR